MESASHKSAMKGKHLSKSLKLNISNNNNNNNNNNDKKLLFLAKACENLSRKIVETAFLKFS